MRKLQKTLAFALTFAMAFGFTAEGTNFAVGTAMASSPQTYLTPSKQVYNNINFINGGFEKPLYDANICTNLNLTAANAHSYGWNYFPMDPASDANIGNMSIDDANCAPGWKTVPVNTVYAQPAYTQANPILYIEIQRAFNYGGNGDFPDVAADGYQWAELNAVVPGRIYQVCKTSTQQTVFYQFYHRARNVSGSSGAVDKSVMSWDAMNFYLRGWTNGATTVPEAAGAIPKDAKGTSALLVNTYVDNNMSWTRHWGTYTVPAGQTLTEFAFESYATQIKSATKPTTITAGSGNLSFGNYLDGISLSYPAFLTVNKTVRTASGTNSDDTAGGKYAGGAQNPNIPYALDGEYITYTIDVTNTGDCDSSRTVLTDTLPDGLAYDPSDPRCSVKIGSGPAGSDVADFAPAGNLASYDAASDTITINLGEGASAGTNTSNGGSVPHQNPNSGGTAASNMYRIVITLKAKLTTGDKNNGNTALAYGDLVTNQARVSYNNKGFEYPEDGTTGKAGAAMLPDSANASPVVSFRLKNTQAGGTVWVDTNNDGAIGAAASERRLSGYDVWMVPESASDYTTPAADVNGNPLAVKTDANGQYVFRGIPAGNYKIVTNYIAHYVGTSAGGSADNKAVPLAGSLAYIGGLGFAPAAANNTVPSGQDIGMLPTLAIRKDAGVNSGPDDNGSAELPVGIGCADTVTYTITVTSYAANPQDLPAGITVADTLPLYMTVITTVPSAALTTGGDGRQTAAFSPASLPAGDTRFVITAKASGAASGAGALVNSATVTYGNRSAASNKTYHTIKNVNFGITKHIDKPAVGDQTFVFLIKRADDAFSTPTATFYGVVTVPSGETSATQTFADCPAGYYTVSEEQSNWRYAPDPAYPGYAAAQTASIYAPSYGQFTFYNRIARENWLAGKATVDNTMVKE